MIIFTPGTIHTRQMFNRDILKDLRKWAAKPNRKPLVIRGARQVGKTTAIEMFSKDFDQFISLNLEKPQDREIFEKEIPFSDLLTSLFIFAQKKRNGLKTLIFIDEIQNSPKAVAFLRYFYEEANDLFVVTAGSLQSTLSGKNCWLLTILSVTTFISGFVKRPMPALKWTISSSTMVN